MRPVAVLRTLGKRSPSFLLAGLWLAAVAAPASAHPVEDGTTRTAVVSAFPPGMAGD